MSQFALRNATYEHPPCRPNGGAPRAAKYARAPSYISWLEFSVNAP
jgi:hypothetical protein